MKVLFASKLVRKLIPKPNLLKKAWSYWSSNHGRTFENESDKIRRKNIWKTANDLIENHNKEFDNGKQLFKIGHNKFSDFSAEEITKLFKGFDASVHTEKRKKSLINLDTSNLPESVDWREKGFVNDVQDQGKYFQ